MKRVEEKLKKRIRRKSHIRKVLSGTSTIPRMSVFKSNRNVSVQIIDDVHGVTLVSASMMENEFKNLKKNVVDAAKLGEVIGARAKEKKIEKIVFDRNGYKYHGIVKALADGARKAGLQF